MLCDNLEGEGVVGDGRGDQGREDTCILMSDSQCGMADINRHTGVNRRPV